MVKFKIKATRFMLIKFTTSGRPMTVFPESRNSMCYLNKRLSILRTILVPQKGLYFYFHFLGKPSRRGRGGLYLKPNECATRLVIWGKGLIYLRALLSFCGSYESGAPNDNFRKIICSEDDLRSRIFGSFSDKFLACLPFLGFSNFKKIV